MEKNRKIIINIGIPGAGKTFRTKEFLRKNSGWVRVSRDEFRLMLRNEQMCEPKVEDLVTKLVNITIHNALSKKLNVIIDNTNVKEKYIKQFIHEFKYSADIDYMIFDISLEKAIERDKNREAKVGEAVIRRMYTDYKVLMDSFDFQPVMKIKHRPVIEPNFNSPLPDCVVVDIDGTLSIMSNRGPFDWDKVDRDRVNKIVAEQIGFHRDHGRKIIIVSGRDGICKELTKEWLDFNNIYYDELYMRPVNDYRKDTIIKKEIYDTYIKPKYNVLCAIDDRLQVLDFYFKEGIFTFNVNQGNLIY
jgi:predicted kinase